MALAKLPKECLMCLNSTKTTFVPNEESQKIFSVCCAYVKDAINIDFLINNIIDNNSQLSFCKNCLDLSLNLSQLVEERSKLKIEINDLASSFAEIIAKQRIQATVNTRKKKLDKRNTKFQATNIQQAKDSSNRPASQAFSSDFNQDSSMNSEYSKNKLTTEQNANVEIPLDIVKIENNFKDCEDESCSDNVSSDKDDEYVANNSAPEDENEDDSCGEMDLEPTFTIANNTNVIPQIGASKLPSKSVVSIGMPNIVLKRISNDDTKKIVDIFNSPEMSKQVKSEVDFDKNLPGGSDAKVNSATSVISKSKIIKRRHACPICQKSFISSSDLKRHRRTHTGEKPHQCTTCGKSYADSRDLKNHERLVHTGERPYQCTTCGKSFAQTKDLKVHERLHTGTGERPYECTACGKSYTRSTELKIHERLHSGERPHQCTVCGKSYTQSKELKIHERLHTGERPYQCSLCESSFIRRNNLRDHEATHTKEKPYKCSQCTKSFMRPSHLKHHEIINHNGQKCFKCSHCKMTFLRHVEWRGHQRIHKTVNSDKLFVCSYCKMPFDRPQDLKDHVRIHTGETPYKCNYCETSFTNRGARKRHQTKFHPEMQEK